MQAIAKSTVAAISLSRRADLANTDQDPIATVPHGIQSVDHSDNDQNSVRRARAFHTVVKSALATISCRLQPKPNVEPREKTAPADLTQGEVRHVCLATVRALKRRLGLTSCVFGRAACRLYGSRRPLRVVEIVILTNRFSWTREYILKLLVLLDERHRFYLAPASSQNSESKELWFALPSRRPCQVLIRLPNFLFTPNALNVPPIPARRLTTIRRIPVMPLVPLLLLNLQSGWQSDIASTEDDVSDMMTFLETKRNIVSQVRRAKRWLPYWFVRIGREDVERYCLRHGLADHASWGDLEAWLEDSDDEYGGGFDLFDD